MKKKVLFVVTKSNFGGAQRYVFDLATNLPSAEFAVAVAFGPAPDGKMGALSKKLFAKGVHTIELDQLGRDVSLLRDWRGLRELTGLFAAEKPDVVHVNSSKAGGLGALAARITHVPRIVFTAHGLATEEKRSRLQKILIGCASWVTMFLTHATIAISNEGFERIRRMPFLHRKAHLIRNGILTPTFLSKQEARSEIRALAPDAPVDAKWVGSIGELHPNKNYAAAIDALAFMESAHLILMGDGEMRESLGARAKEKGVADRVHFLGYVPEAAKYLRAFDAFVLPSHKEGLPYVLLEAGYAYIPVVASDIPGVRDVILPDFTGVLVPPDDAKALAMALERILNDATLSRSLSDELLKRVQRTFPLEGMLEKTLKLYTA